MTGFNSKSLAVVDVTNPTSPSIVGSVVSPSVMDGVRDGLRCMAVSLALSTLRPHLDHVSLETSASLLRARPLWQARGVTVRGSFAYVTGFRTDSLAVVNVSDPTSPSIVGSVVSPSVMDGVRDGPGGWQGWGA